MKSWKTLFTALFLCCSFAVSAWASTTPAKSTAEWKPKPNERWLEVVKKERKIFLRQGDQVLKTYRVAIGSGKGTKKSPIDKITPVGTFTIRRVADASQWIFDPKVFNEPGEPQKDVYGRWAISFRNPWNLAIHGTNAPWSIGKAVTHGCIRMKNSDIEELVRHVKPGMKLVIREKAVKPKKSEEKALKPAVQPILPKPEENLPISSDAVSGDLEQPVSQDVEKASVPSES